MSWFPSAYWKIKRFLVWPIQRFLTGNERAEGFFHCSSCCKVGRILLRNVKILCEVRSWKVVGILYEFWEKEGWRLTSRYVGRNHTGMYFELQSNFIWVLCTLVYSKTLYNSLGKKESADSKCNFFCQSTWDFFL